MKFFKKYAHDIIIAMEAIMANKVKSILTALGIIFGVAAVISMLAIGNGAKQEILEQMKLVGVNNIIITPKEKKTKSNDDSENKKIENSKKFSRGLSLADALAIEKHISTVNAISPEIELESFAIKNGIRKSAKMFGVLPQYFDLYNIKLDEGTLFNKYQLNRGLPICIISQSIKSKFFKNSSPIGETIKCGGEWLKIIGVTEKRMMVDQNNVLGINIGNFNIYIPIKTMLLRFKNNSFDKVHKGSDADSKKTANLNQLDKLTIQVKETKFIKPTTQLLSRMMLRRHNMVSDFNISVPEQLLKQEQKTKDIFNIVLGVIAGISLVVGGIGIMNIMLASVMERIKEIGTRMALGASKKDIVVQFLAESILISVVGGFIGVVLGVIFAMLITKFAGILTIVSPISVIIAFGVSASVGILFGYMPAKKASEQDPIESLR